MRLGRTQVSLLLAVSLTVAGCSVSGGNSPETSASPTASAPAAKPVQSATAPKPKPSAPQSIGYNPRYCGVTSHTKDGKPSSALLTMDDFPYKDGNGIVKVAEWAKQTNTMMEAFPIAKEVNAYDRKHRTNLVTQARALGTYVSNHTYSHGNLIKVGSTKAKAQIAGGVKSTYVRPPYGAYDDETRELIEKEQKARVCHWTIDTEDWQKLKDGSYPSAKELARRVHKQLKGVKRGEPVVILGHYHTNYPSALPAIRSELVRAKLHICETPPAPTTANVPFPIC